jgi:hypothetical protein
MPAIGDQVASLELDHVNALAQIAALTARVADLTAQLTHASAFTESIKNLAGEAASAALALVTASTSSPFIAAVEKDAQTTMAFVENEGAKVESLFTTAPAAPITPAPPNPAPTGQPVLQTDSGDEQPHATPLPAAQPIAAKPSPLAHLEAVATAIENKVAAIPDAVERMLHHSSGTSTAIRAPVDLTMHVEHDDGGLPIFLRRGTAFEAMTRRPR